MKTTKTINPKLIKNKWYKDFNEILNEKLDKLNDILKNKWSYELKINDDYFWLYFKDKNNWFYMQSLAFFSDIEIFKWISWNINLYDLIK